MVLHHVTAQPLNLISTTAMASALHIIAELQARQPNPVALSLAYLCIYTVQVAVYCTNVK